MHIAAGVIPAVFHPPGDGNAEPTGHDFPPATDLHRSAVLLGETVGEQLFRDPTP
jgi:hypothetical protein